MHFKIKNGAVRAPFYRQNRLHARETGLGALFVLIARDATDADTADHLAICKDWYAARGGYDARQSHHGRAALGNDVREHAGRAPVHCADACFHNGDFQTRGLGIVHTFEIDEPAVGIDNGDCDIPLIALAFGDNTRGNFFRTGNIDGGAVSGPLLGRYLHGNQGK
jgi:hypothetical protein